jgi:peptidoglycan/LPS O-acetylase OafA/YrhL
MRLFMRLTALGKLGVNLFFVLSGFLITGILLAARDKPHYYKRFYWHRALRILPAYFAALLGVLLLTGAWKFALLSSLFLANLTSLFGVILAYGPLWSLAVEEHFYLLWPTVVRRGKPPMIAAIAALLCVLVPILRSYSQAASPLHFATWYNCDGLALGALLRLGIRKWPSRTVWRVVSPVMIVIGIGGILTLTGFGVVGEETRPGFALQISCWNLIFAGFLSAMLLLGTSRWRRFAVPSALVFLGYVSYSLYLCHLLVYIAIGTIWPNISMFPRFVLGASTATAIAWLSRRFYEERFLRMKEVHFDAAHQRVPVIMDSRSTAQS